MSEMDEHWEETVAILEESLKEAGSDEERNEIHRKIARIYDERLEDLPAARPHYEAVFAADPTDDEALEALERVYRDRGDEESFQALATAFIDRSQASSDSAGFVSWLRRASEVFSKDLQNPESAFLVLLSALNADTANDRELIDELTALGDATGQLDELAARLEELLEELDSKQLVLDFRRLLATWFEEKFFDPERAARHLEAATKLQPPDTGLLARLIVLYENSRNWERLADTLRQHADLSEEKNVKVGDFLRLASVLEEELGRAGDAVDVYRKILEIDGTNPRALDALERVYRMQGRSADLIRILEKKSSSTADSSLLENLRSQIAREWDRLGDVDRAISTLRDSSIGRQTLIHNLKSAAEQAESDYQRARYFYEIGRVYRELGNDVSAYSYFETSIQHDPDYYQASLPLIDHYLRDDRWERALPLLGRLVEKHGHELEPRERHQRLVQFAQTLDRAGNAGRAYQAYRDAYDIDPDNLETLRGLANHLFRREEFDHAFRLMMTLQYEHGAQLDRRELGELFHRAAFIKETRGERRAAIELYEQALEQEARPESRLALVPLLEAEEMWESLIRHTEKLLQEERDPAIRFKYLGRLGDVWGSRLNRPDLAVSRYQQALEIEPDSIAILRKLIDLFQKAGKWQQAVKVLHELAEREPDPERKCKYYYTIGVIHRDELGQDVRAVSAFDSALDCDVRFLKAFEAIDRILTGARAWKELERAYRRMLRRVAEKDDGSYDDLYFLLWTNLGEIYRTRMNHARSAIEAYRTASRLRPDDARVREILLELYDRAGTEPNEAIAEHRELLRQDPFRVPSYHALYDLYMRQRRFDRAWAVAGVLCYLQKATQNEEQVYRQYVGRNIRLLKGRFTPELLRMLYHPMQDVSVSMLMSYLSVGLRDHISRSLKDWGVHRRRNRIDEDEKDTVARMFNYVVDLVGLMPRPALYLMRDQPIGLRNMNVDPPAFVMGGDLYEGYHDRELVFLLAKTLMMGRPEGYLASVGYPPEVLNGFVLAAMHCTDPSQNFIETMGKEGERLASEIQSLPGPQLLEIMKIVKVYSSQRKLPDLKKWLKGIELTTDRAGLLVCGDIQKAAWTIRNGDSPIGAVSRDDRVRELLRFAVSDEYRRLRRRFGVAVD